MKKITLFIAAVFLLTFSSCEEKIDYSRLENSTWRAEFEESILGVDFLTVTLLEDHTVKDEDKGITYDSQSSSWTMEGDSLFINYPRSFYSGEKEEGRQVSFRLEKIDDKNMKGWVIFSAFLGHIAASDFTLTRIK